MNYVRVEKEEFDNAGSGSGTHINFDKNFPFEIVLWGRGGRQFTVITFKKTDVSVYILGHPKELYNADESVYWSLFNVDELKAHIYKCECMAKIKGRNSLRDDISRLMEKEYV